MGVGDVEVMFFKCTDHFWCERVVGFLRVNLILKIVLHTNFITEAFEA